MLDRLAIVLHYACLILLPLMGLIFLFRPEQRRLGLAILLAFLAALLFSELFKLLAARPRPQPVRLVIPLPGSYAYPSSHAAIAFSVALVLALIMRRPIWWMIALLGAGLVGLSRIYLGVHYPSDVWAGTILGSATGASCYGLIITWQPLYQRLSWLIWLHVAVALTVTQMAYLDILPYYLLHWPLADKVLHFILFGLIAFWLNLWLNGRKVRLAGWTLPLALLIAGGGALIEESLQFFSPLRSLDIVDLSSNLAGLIFFWWLSQRILQVGATAETSPISHPPQIPPR